MPTANFGFQSKSPLNGRFAAKVEDVKELAHPVLRHRIVPTFNAEAEGITVESIIDRCLEAVPEKRSHSLINPFPSPDGHCYRFS